jgi:NADPH2:quinone reductase
VIDMSHAIRFHKTGGPEVLQWEEVPVGEPGPGEARVAHKAIGLNFIETYHRSGLYPLPLPSGLGTEASGVVEAVGPNVTEVKAGDRVAYANGPLGSYSEKRVMPADRLVKLPDGISFEQGASMMLQGLTVQYLLRRMLIVPKAGDTILWQAAAGGVGLIACQWAKALGITLIGTVSSEEKAKLAREHGAAHTINYAKEDFPARVNEITGGKKVPVAYDSVGKDTFMKSLDCVQPRGLLVLFGNASGPGRRAQHGTPRRQGFALRDASHARFVRRQARGAGGVVAGALRARARGAHQGGTAAELRPQGRGAGAPRPRGEEDDRVDDPRAVRRPAGEVSARRTCPSRGCRPSARARCRRRWSCGSARRHRFARPALPA